MYTFLTSVVVSLKIKNTVSATALYSIQFKFYISCLIVIIITCMWYIFYKQSDKKKKHVFLRDYCFIQQNSCIIDVLEKNKKLKLLFSKGVF